MMRLSTVYSNANTLLSIKNNGLVEYQSKAPVHWGVNATLPLASCKLVRLRPLCIGV